jgi:hypothetical protein
VPEEVSSFDAESFRARMGTGVDDIRNTYKQL